MSAYVAIWTGSLVGIFLWLREEVKYVYKCLHLDQKSSFQFSFTFPEPLLVVLLFKISVFNYVCLIYRNVDFCMFTLYFVTLLNPLVLGVRFIPRYSF